MFDRQAILSRPLRVHWAGWETNTHRLQQCGWQLSAEQDVYNGSMRIAMQHQGQSIRAISARIDFDYHMAISATPDYLSHINIPMHMVAREIVIHEHGKVDWSFKPIDATPMLRTTTISRIEDLVHFAAPLVRCNEVIIPDESVPELMERILKLQQPARTDRIRAEMRNPDGMILDAIPKQKFHAQIISLAA